MRRRAGCARGPQGTGSFNLRRSYSSNNATQPWPAETRLPSDGPRPCAPEADGWRRRVQSSAARDEVPAPRNQYRVRASYCTPVSARGFGTPLTAMPSSKSGIIARFERSDVLGTECNRVAKYKSVPTARVASRQSRHLRNATALQLMLRS